MIPALLATVVLTGSAGDVAVTRGMKRIGEVTSFGPMAILKTAFQVATSGFIWTGIACKTIAFFSFLALLSHSELSWAVPAGATTYVVDTLAAKYILKETITPLRWAGALCVGLGVALLSL